MRIDHTKGAINWNTVGTFICGASAVVGFVLSLIGSAKNITSSLFLISIISGGVFVLHGALQGIIRSKFLNIEFLVILASVGAIYLGELSEASAVIFFFSLAEAFESFGVKRSRKALLELIQTHPKQATHKDGSIANVEAIPVGAVIIVKPGDVVPLDGIIVFGESTINEATITGESIPRDKAIGDHVYSGTTNLNGYLEIQVNKKNQDSTITKIVQLIASAQKSKTHIEEFINRFAKYYTPIIVIMAILIVVLPILGSNADLSSWLERAITLLVIACPCALVIAVPVTVTAALGGASRKGVLIKGGKFLELLGNIKAIAFDKTGTLTEGRPMVSNIKVLDGFTEQQLLEDVAGMESFSTHPLSEAILQYTRDKGITPHQMESYQNIAGKGGRAICKICSDLEHCVGNIKMMDAHNVSVHEVTKDIEKLESEGKTVVLVSEDDKIMGLIGITDTIQTRAQETVKRLLNEKVSVVMLSGDNIHSASYVATELGIENVYAGLLPEEKVEKLRDLKYTYGSIAMVGDGINDAPALALSDVGIAMGHKGADIALETADIVIMNNSLVRIPEMIQLGKQTFRVVKFNIGIAVISKIVFVLLTILGISHLGIAIAADTGVAIFVILNGLRLFK